MSASSSTELLLNRKWFIYASPPVEALASRFPGTVLPIQRAVFSDGSPNIKIGGIPEIMSTPRGANVLYFHAYRNLHEKKVEEMILFVLAETCNVKRLVVVDPFDAWATMERIAVEGEVASANIDAHFWKHLPMTQFGQKPLRLVYDQHTLQNRFFYQGGNTQVAFRSGVPIFLDHIQTHFGWRPDEKHAIAFPDEGACKRFGKGFPGYELIICAKKRDGDSRVVTVMDGDCKGRHVVIIDDLVRSGGTLIECAKGLLDLGAAQVSCYVTHAEFPQEAWKKFLPEQLPFTLSHFWVTNSCADVTSIISSKPPFSVIDLSSDIQSWLNLL